MTTKLPLDSPLWSQVSACYSVENAVEQLRTIVTTRELGEAWDSLRDEMLHQGGVYGASSAAIPHLVDLAPELSPQSRAYLWIELAFLVTAGADEFRSPPAPGLQEGVTEALRRAESLALRDFLATTDQPPDTAIDLALACVALAGHAVGEVLWESPSLTSGYVHVVCPGCESGYEVDGFGDPLAPPCPPPLIDNTAGLAAGHQAAAWRGVALAVDRAGRDQVLGPGWDGFFEVARRVAESGVAPRTAPSAVWCLVAAMVATRSAADWARTLARVSGHFRCLECDEVWAIADIIGGQGGEAVDAAAIPPDTVADGVFGFRPAPGRVLREGHRTLRTLWRHDGGPVDALAVVPGSRPVVAVGTDHGIRLWDAISGAPVGWPADKRWDESASAIASISLSDGRTVVVVADDSGGLRWWDPDTGELLDTTLSTGAPMGSLAPIFMPANATADTVRWLAALREGRTVLAAGDADGTVRLWDPLIRSVAAEPFRRPGRPVVGLTPADFGDQSPSHGTRLVAVYGDQTVDIWSSTTVHGNRSTMAPGEARLAAIGHERLIGAVATGDPGHREPFLLSDANGTVSMWTTLGVRQGDPLPADPAHREVVGIATQAAPDGAMLVMTASRADRSLRIWEPARGTVTLLPIDQHPRCLASVGDVLLVGHDGGLVALSLSD